jgi:predicted alpha/beta hydrolase
MNSFICTTVRIPATDGLALAASVFRTRQDEVQGTMIVAGAVGNVRGNYAEFGRAMAERGWNVVTFDYRGIGESQRAARRAADFSMMDWGEKDLAGMIAWARSHLPSPRLVLIGHSIGGQIAALAPNHDDLDALVGVAAQRGYWRYWPGLNKYLVYGFFGVFVPLAVKLRGFLPLRWAGLESLPAAAARDWSRWGLAHDYLDADRKSLKKRFESFRAPILAMSFSDDPSLAPRTAVDALFAEHYVPALVTRWHLEPSDFGVSRLGHSGFFQPNICPGSLWQATLDWILARTPRRRCRRRSACNRICGKCVSTFRKTFALEGVTR